MSRFDEIRELTRARFVLFVREPEAIFWVFVFPLVLASVLGFAFRSAGVSPVKIAVVEGDGASALVAALEPDEHIEIETCTTRDEAYMKLTRAAVDGMVEPGDPPTLTFDVARAEAATAELRVRRMLALAIDPGSEAPLVIEPVTETGSRYVDFLFPGLIGMNLMGSGMWGVGFGIADMRRRKFLKRLLVTPMRHSSFFLSFMLSRLVFLVIELIVLVGFAALVLGVPFNGNIFAFAIVAVIGAATFAGIGILVASRARTIEAVSGMMNLVMMPMWLASGVFFSYEKFPDAIHPLLKLLPLTALNDGLRAVMLDGDPLVSQLPELAVLLGWCAVTFVVGGRIFRWE
ncbi:MAG: ABC transporter permease [Planctomycetota bacterium]|jgi:ABC-type polysaccharide/polyol phosphate export permease